MAWYFIVGALAAFGLICILWILYGCLLGKAADGMLICICDGCREEDLLLRYNQLRGAGLLHCPLIMADSRLSPREQEILQRRHPGLEFCTLEQLIHRLETERLSLD